METFEKCSILFKFKEGENFNHRNTLSILRIKLKLHCVQNVEPDAEIGQKGAFCKGLLLNKPDYPAFRRGLSPGKEEGRCKDLLPRFQGNRN